MISNDYFDIEIDKINNPQRPLPTGMISINELTILACLFTITGFLTASLLGLVTLIFAIIVWIIAISYNWKFKRKWFNREYDGCYFSCFLFYIGGASVGGLTDGLIWIFGILAFTFDLGEEIAADAMDMVGDKKRSTKTIALLYGKQDAILISISLFTLFVGLSLIPIVIGWLSKLYLIIFIPMNISIIYLSIKLYKSQPSKMDII